MHQDLFEMINGSKEGALLLDPDRNVIFWNKAAERLMGFRKEEIMGSAWSDNILVHEDDGGRDLSTESFPLLLTLDDNTPRMAEIFVRHRRGYRIPVSRRTLPFEDEEDAIALDAKGLQP